MPVEDRLGAGVESSRGAASLSGGARLASATGAVTSMGLGQAPCASVFLRAVRRETFRQRDLEILPGPLRVVKPGKHHTRECLADSTLDRAKIRLLIGGHQRVLLPLPLHTGRP